MGALLRRNAAPRVWPVSRIRPTPEHTRPLDAWRSPPRPSQAAGRRPPDPALRPICPPSLAPSAAPARPWRGGRTRDAACPQVALRSRIRF